MNVPRLCKQVALVAAFPALAIGSPLTAQADPNCSVLTFQACNENWQNWGYSSPAACYLEEVQFCDTPGTSEPGEPDPGIPPNCKPADWGTCKII